MVSSIISHTDGELGRCCRLPRSFVGLLAERDTHQRRPPSLPVIWKADALGSKSLGGPRNRRDSGVVV